MIARACGLGRQLLPPHRHLLLHRQAHSTANLPKSSRFAQEVGLHAELHKISRAAHSSEHSTQGAYQVVIGVGVCLVAALGLGYLLDSRKQQQLGLVFSYARYSGRVVAVGQALGLVRQLLDYVGRYYRGRGFEDGAVARAVQFWARYQPHGGTREQVQEFRRLLGELIEANLRNKAKKKECFQAYRCYFENMLMQDQEMSNNQVQAPFLSPLITTADIQTLFIITLAHSKQKIALTQADRHEMKQKAQMLQKQRQNRMDKFRQATLNKNILVQPYEFILEVEGKWLQFILHNI